MYSSFLNQFVCRLAIFLLFTVGSVTANSDYFQVYLPETLSGISATDSCITALTSNVTCSPDLKKAVTDTSTWSANGLSQICAANCSVSLENYISSVNTACGSSTTYNISNTLQLASDAGSEMQWRYNATCLKDPSTGTYCNTLLQSGMNGSSSTVKCSTCYLTYLHTVLNSKWGQDLFSPTVLQNQVKSCSTTGYSVTYTPTSTASSTSVSSSATDTPRCNTTDGTWNTYTVKSGDSCTGISASQNVSTGILTSINGLDTGCTHLSAGADICLPDVCQVYLVQWNDTISGILNKLSRDVSQTQFLSWNRNINSANPDLSAVGGKYICISPPGSLELGTTFPLKAATTAVSVPTDAVTSSNTKCGYWHQVQGNETCDTLVSDFGITKNDLMFLNPQIDSGCTNLWLGNSYCVEPVGNVKTYSGYSNNGTATYTQLSATIQANNTMTANRTTRLVLSLFLSLPNALIKGSLISYSYYSWATNTTTTAFTSTNGTIQSMLSSYTLCDEADEAFNITDGDLTQEMYEDEAWMSEYQRVCYIPIDGPIPTRGFNYSITLDSSPYYTTSNTATAAASITVTTASQTSSTTTQSATSTGLTVSPNGLCGSSNSDYTCTGSQFGSCCSKYGYW
ncbi:hypothetical protein N7507_005178 [Penicillium longicatenatum]|nr:hypothetical protein N7507_005178 [Penicillium longicatenatum]